MSVVFRHAVVCARAWDLKGFFANPGSRIRCELVEGKSRAKLLICTVDNAVFSPWQSVNLCNCQCCLHLKVMEESLYGRALPDYSCLLLSLQLSWLEIWDCLLLSTQTTHRLKLMLDSSFLLDGNLFFSFFCARAGVFLFFLFFILWVWSLGL